MLINSTKRKISLNKNPRIVNKYFLNFSKRLCNTQYVSEIMSNKLFALTKHTHFFFVQFIHISHKKSWLKGTKRKSILIIFSQKAIENYKRRKYRSIITKNDVANERKSLVSPMDVAELHHWSNWHMHQVVLS